MPLETSKIPHVGQILSKQSFVHVHAVMAHRGPQ
jgi:hypothetical protein